jgi:hypothetical protein
MNGHGGRKKPKNEDETQFDREHHTIEDVMQSSRMSFLIGCECSGRGSMNTSFTEQDAVDAWVRETLRRYLLLDDVINGVRILEMHGGEFTGRKPNLEESLKIRDWVIR